MKVQDNALIRGFQDLHLTLVIGKSDSSCAKHWEDTYILLAGFDNSIGFYFIRRQSTAQVNERTKTPLSTRSDFY